MQQFRFSSTSRGLRICGRFVYSLLLAFSLISLVLSPSRAMAAPAPKSFLGSPSDVINAVNAVRLARGLAPLQVNAALMAAAQAHSEYQASIGSVTHSGAGGSNPKARAIAAGYGGGANVGVTENIFGGGKATPQQAVNWWQGDSLHLNTMIGSNYQDVGAGVATDGNSYYYTLDVGYIAGSGNDDGNGNPGSGGTAAPGVAPATQVAFYPVLVATPAPDGSVVHTVQAGQTLWVIAATYKISLADLLAQNGMTDNSYIFPGDQLIIKQPDNNPQPTVAQTQESAQISPTRRPTGTPVPEATAAETAAAVAMLQSTTAASSNAPPAASPLPSGQDLLLGIISILVLGGAGLFVLGNLLNRREGATK